MTDTIESTDWKTVRLNDVSKILSGYAFKSTDFVSKGVPVIKISNVGYSQFEWKNQQYLTDDFLEKQKGYKIFPGDLLIALTRPITNDTTKACIYPINAPVGLLNQRVACIKENGIDRNFLFYYFQTQTFKNYIRSKFSETLQPNLSPKDLELTLIPFCSAAQQNKVVSKIEELFSELDNGIENLRIAQQQLKIYRQAVLKWAFEGKLTNDNLKEGELPKGWKMVKTIDAIKTINNGYTPTKEYLSEGSGEVPFIKVYNLTFNGKLNFEKNPTYIPNANHQKDLKRSICLPGDVLIILLVRH